MNRWLLVVVAIFSFFTLEESLAEANVASRQVQPDWCSLPSYGMPPLRDVQEALRDIYEKSRRSIESARTEARRSARLPEYVRVQAGARMDSDRENRLRLAQDFDGFGVPSKSSLEDRSTNQQDLYVDVRASAEWRLSRLRWSEAETALRRENAQASDRLREDLKSLHEWWIELLLLGQIICENPSDDPPTSQRSSTRATKVRPGREEAFVRFTSLAERIDFLTEGFLFEHWHALRREGFRTTPNLENEFPQELFSSPDPAIAPDSD